MTNLFPELNTVAISAPMTKGSMIFQSGDPRSAIYLVLSGRISQTEGSLRLMDRVHWA